MVDPSGESLNTIFDALRDWETVVRQMISEETNPGQRRAAPELQQRIHDLAASGISVSEIASQLHLEKRYVLSLLARVPRPLKRRTPRPPKRR